MRHPHEVVWFVVTLSAGGGLLVLILVDIRWPQVRGWRGVRLRGRARQWWRALEVCLALLCLGNAGRAWAGDAAIAGWGAAVGALATLLGLVCLSGLIISLLRQEPPTGDDAGRR